MTILQIGSWTATSRKCSHNCNMLCRPGGGAGHAGVCRTPKMQGWCKEGPRPGTMKELKIEHYWECNLCLRIILACGFGSPLKGPKKFLKPHSTMRKDFLKLERGCEGGMYSETEFVFQNLMYFFYNWSLHRLAVTRDFAIQWAAYAVNAQLWRDPSQRMNLPSLCTYQQWLSGQSVQHQPEEQITKFIHKMQ